VDEQEAERILQNLIKAGMHPLIAERVIRSYRRHLGILTDSEIEALADITTADVENARMWWTWEMGVIGTPYFTLVLEAK